MTTFQLQYLCSLHAELDQKHLCEASLGDISRIRPQESSRAYPHVLNTHVQVFISGVVAGCWEKPGDMIRESVGT